MASDPRRARTGGKADHQHTGCSGHWRQGNGAVSIGRIICREDSAAIYLRVKRRSESAASFENVNYYKNNARVIADALDRAGVWYTGGVNSPYIWLACPGGMTSWEFFDYLLSEANVVGTPGSGFGPSGEGYFRLTAFNTYENTVEAVERMKALKK